MTAIDPLLHGANEAQRGAARPWWKRIDAAIERAGEFLNPILVKESRQALKSKQFLITFSLLLICGWGWSIVGIAVQWPGIYYAPGGRGMLLGYYFVLALPLLVVVPFSAFRSLAAEREDGTYELLSITALSARQIVTGKLGSSVLQMLVYFSALSPCIAFTYLLRGIDIVTIVMLLVYTFMVSLMLAVAGLLLATVTRARHWQVLISVLLIVGLLIALYIWSACVIGLLYEMLPYDEPVFWVANLALLMFYVSFLALFVSSAAARISFASDNRSTRLRVLMLAQQVLLVGWCGYWWIVSRDSEVLYAFMMFAGLYWFFCGALMTGEAAQLSPRTKRRLPQSVLGRVALTWFNPGSGTGYVFATTNLFCLLLLTAVATVVGEALSFDTSPDYQEVLFVSLLVCCYVATYLGVGRLFILAARRFVRIDLPVSLLIHVLLAVFGAAAPFIFNLWLVGTYRLEYSPLQLTNWWWTLAEAIDGNMTGWWVVLVAMVFAAGVTFFVNLILAAREIEQVRQETPERVVEDEIQRHGEKTPQQPAATSPWDNPPSAPPATSV